MNTVVQRLVNDHVEEDRLLDEIRELSNDNEKKRKFQVFSRNLKYHIFLEEEILFPKLDITDSIIIELMSQHAAMWNLMALIEESYDINLLNMLSSLLKVHNAIEEANVYPRFDELELKEISEEIPEGWVPKFMREKP
jgi:hemerythrin superfamily protein